MTPANDIRLSIVCTTWNRADHLEKVFANLLGNALKFTPAGGRVRFEAATDAEVIDALQLTMRTEGIIPALESAHAFVQAFKDAPKMNRHDAIIINMSGRGDKDIFTIAHAFDDPSWKRFIIGRGDEYRNSLGE